jgi:hypothetical protein
MECFHCLLECEENVIECFHCIKSARNMSRNVFTVPTR